MRSSTNPEDNCNDSIAACRGLRSCRTTTPSTLIGLLAPSRLASSTQNNIQIAPILHENKQTKKVTRKKTINRRAINKNTNIISKSDNIIASPLTLTKLWKARSRRKMVTSDHPNTKLICPDPHQLQVQKKSMGRIEDRFARLELIGSGAYGTVYRAMDRRNHSTVALKRIKLNNDETEEDGVPSSSLREIGLLKDLKHPNVLRLLDVQICENNLYLVFEHLDLDLKKLLDRNTNGLMKPLVKSYMKQLLHGLAYCHARRVLHRDLKLQNLLVDRQGNIKLADFGLARSICLPIRTYTHEVVTLWYRSPELLLKANQYGPSVDIWSLGCIFAEMLTKKILFPGESEIDQLYRIFRTLGTPDDSCWPGFTKMPEYRNFYKFKSRGIENYIGKDDPLAIDLIEKLLSYDPLNRISAIQALNHPYVHDVKDVDASILSGIF